jgi:hypothetical protein
MPRVRQKRWRQKGLYAFTRGRRPVVLKVEISTHGRWRGSIEWYLFPNTGEPTKIWMTHLYASHEEAMDATERSLVRLQTGLAKL